MHPEKVSVQLSSEQSVGDVWIAQLDRKRVPQERCMSVLGKQRFGVGGQSCVKANGRTPQTSSRYVC